MCELYKEEIGKGEITKEKIHESAAEGKRSVSAGEERRKRKMMRYG